MRNFQVDASRGNAMDIPGRSYHEKLSEFMRKQSSVNDEQSLQNEVNPFQGNGLDGFRFPHINFTACIASTRAVANTEQLLYTTLTNATAILKSAVKFGVRVVACHSESSNTLESLLCFISELENSGNIWESILSDLYYFLSGLENDPLITDLKNCVGQ